MNVYVKRVERRKKMSKIVCSTVVASTNITDFINELHRIIGKYQDDCGLEVEIQYAKHNVQYSALVLGRK